MSKKNHATNVKEFPQPEPVETKETETEASDEEIVETPKKKSILKKIAPWAVGGVAIAGTIAATVLGAILNRNDDSDEDDDDVDVSDLVDEDDDSDEKSDNADSTDNSTES